VNTPPGFLPIPSCPGYYVNASGHVLSLRRGGPRVMSRYLGDNGYLRVGLFVNRRPVTKDLHVLMAEAFHGPARLGQLVRHLDGNPLHDTPDNVVWGTPSENQIDCIQHGRNNRLNRTHCPQGHPYDAANTCVRPNGHRSCRRCAADRMRLHRTRQPQMSGGTR
jgi:hypothetical protein